MAGTVITFVQMRMCCVAGRIGGFKRSFEGLEEVPVDDVEMWRVRSGQEGQREERGSGTETDAVDWSHQSTGGTCSLLTDYQEAGNLGPPL